MSLKNYKSFPLSLEYLNCLTVIKDRSQNTVVEYLIDGVRLRDIITGG
ncbi:MAG TPA: hypothetical protein GX401_06635 [Clostridiales bacterium]|nr:hypothetical protein [Clostridiales bacterium]